MCNVYEIKKATDRVHKKHSNLIKNQKAIIKEYKNNENFIIVEVDKNFGPYLIERK